MSTVKIKPILDQILVKRKEPDTKTKGGLFIPELAQEQPLYGTVVDVGPGKIGKNGIREPMPVKTGDRIFFTKNATLDVMHDGEEHVIMKENRVLLIDER